MKQSTADKIINFCANHGFVSQVKTDGFVYIRIPDNEGGYMDHKVKTVGECLAVLGY